MLYLISVTSLHYGMEKKKRKDTYLPVRPIAKTRLIERERTRLKDRKSAT